MRVLFVNPHYPMPPSSVLLHPPLAYAYMTPELRARGHEVACLDLPMRSNDIRVETAYLEDFAPDVIGVTCVTQSYCQALEVARFCKELLPNVPVVMGGPHATFTAVETLNRHRYVDYVMRFDSDRTCADLVDMLAARDLGRRSAVEGLVWRADDGTPVAADRVPAVEMDLDRYPRPDRSIFDLQAYLDHDYETVVVSARGCPSRCSFCSTTRAGRRYRFHGTQSIIDELESLLDFGFSSVFFGDDTFPADPERTIELCGAMVERGLNFAWTSNMRILDARPEVLDAMVAAGAYRVFTGIETVKRESLHTIQKGTTPDRIREGVARVKAAGLEVHTAFIVGVPGDTPADLEATLGFIDEVDPTVATFNTIEVRPGTPMAYAPERYGLTVHDPYWYEGTSWMDLPTCSTRELDRYEIKHWVERCYAQFCSSRFGVSQVVGMAL